MERPPIIVLGVSRSGTTLLRTMLDRHPDIAIPSESYFIPQLHDRHGDRPDRARIIADLGRLQRVREWGITPDDLESRLGPEPTFAQVIDAVYSTWAERQGARCYGDKTPLYMQHLPLLDHVFPDARYVHIVRDPRPAALSFVGMSRRARFNWSRPRRVEDFACQWRMEVASARELGRRVGAHRYLELRYEDLVAAPEHHLRSICTFLDLAWDPVMLDHTTPVTAGTERDHQLLGSAPVANVRDWRAQMGGRQVARVEAIAGTTMRAYGYDLTSAPRTGALVRLRAASERALHRSRLWSWQHAVALVRRSPAWKLRQRQIRRSST
jgi:hypothetical protein